MRVDEREMKIEKMEREIREENMRKSEKGKSR